MEVEIINLNGFKLSFVRNWGVIEAVEKIGKKPHHLKWAHITNINMMTMNVLCRRVRMNNAWPDLQSSEWKAASWKLRCLNTWSQFEPQLSLKKIFTTLSSVDFFLWATAQSYEFLELEGMSDNAEEWTWRTLNLIYSCAIIQDYFPLLSLHC